MLISKNFTLNNIDNRDKNVILVTFDNEVLSSIGIPYARDIVTSESYSSLNPIFKEEEVEPDNVVLNLIYIDDYGIPQRWTEDKIINIKKWIITKDFVPFVSEDNPNYVYYLICTRVESKMTPEMIGVLECTFKPLSHYKYKILNVKMDMENNRGIISNPSVETYKPILKIKNLGDETTVNRVNNFEIEGLKKDEIVFVDNLLKTVLNDSDENKFSLCNREWLELNPRENEIVINGNCEVEILCEFPILL